MKDPISIKMIEIIPTKIEKNIPVIAKILFFSPRTTLATPKPKETNKENQHKRRRTSRTIAPLDSPLMPPGVDASSIPAVIITAIKTTKVIELIKNEAKPSVDRCMDAMWVELTPRMSSEDSTDQFDDPHLAHLFMFNIASVPQLAQYFFMPIFSMTQTCLTRTLGSAL
jgi:hypothetical protein